MQVLYFYDLSTLHELFRTLDDHVSFHCRAGKVRGRETF